MVEFMGKKIPNISPIEMQNRINKFDKVFSEQIPNIDKKLDKTRNSEPKCFILISEYAEDILKMRKMVDKLKELRAKKGIVSKMRLTKFLTIDSRKFMIFSLKLLKKWKKYDSDIINFPIKDSELT